MKKRILALLMAGILVLQSGTAVFAGEMTAVETETETVATEMETETVETEAIAAETETESIVAETEMVVTESETVAAETETAETEAAVVESEAENAETEAIVVESEAENAETETIVVETETETAETETIVVESETEAAETETIVVESETETEVIETESTVVETETENVETETETVETETETVETEIETVVLKIEETASQEVKTLNSSAVATGTCGENAKWTLTSDGVLTISGTGAMADYIYESDQPPYYTYKSQITSIVVEEGITKIGDYAFQGLSSATGYTLPSTVTTIGSGAFYYCTGLTSADIPDHVTELGGGIFYCCSGVTSASLPSHLTKIPNAHFEGCSSLNYVKIPKGVTTIGARAFAGAGLDTVTFPIGLTTIETEAFRWGEMTELVIPSSVTTIGLCAFAECANLTNVYFYGNFPTDSSSVFSKEGITIHYLPGTSGWTDENVKLLISGTYDYAYTLKEWMSSSGTCGTNVTWSLDSKGVLTISGSGTMTDYAYSESDGAYTAPWYTLRDGILKVVVEGDVDYIGELAFAYLENLKEVVIQEGVPSIGESAFWYCMNLKSVAIPETVTEIGNECFTGCWELEEVKLPSGLKKIGYGVFCETGLKSIEIPASVEVIDGCAFFYCDELAEITFAADSHLTAINEMAFYSTAVTEVSLPDSVTTLERHLFYRCENLTSIKLPSNLKAVPSLMLGYCKNLKQIEIPSTVTSIGEAAFIGSGLTSITIPAAVTKIGAYTFLECTALTDVYFEGAKPEVSTVMEYDGTTNAYAFDGITTNIHYPYGGTGWTETAPADWGGTLTMIPEGIAGGTCGTNVKWTLSQQGEMLISGSGAMADCTDYTAPWESLKEDIVKVTIADGVTSIGDEAFYECINIKEVKIGNSVTNIGNFAFGSCVSLTEVTIPKSVVTVESNAFRDCGLKTILFMGNCPATESYAFAILPHEDTVTVKYHEGSTGWTNADIKSIGDVPVAAGYDRFIYEFSMQSHNWQNETHTKNATCTTLAERTYTCSICKEKKTETYGSLKAHTAGSWTTTKSAACTASGTKVQKCTVCQKQLNSQTISATGHSFGNWTVTAKATVFAAQQEKRTCSKCKNVETRSVGSALEPTIEVNVTNIPLKVKQSTTVVKVTGLQNGDYIKSWKSNKPSVATVTQKGKITGKKKGKAKITITLASGKTATVTVKVQLTSVKSKYMTMVGSTKIELERGKTFNLVKEKELTVYPLTSKQKMTFYSSNKKVATVNSKGVITAKAGGTAKIYVFSGLAKKLTFTVTVPKIKTKSISGIIKNQTIERGLTQQLKPVLTPKNSEEKITYKSSNKKVATVTSSGKVTAKKRGTATITIKSGDVTFKIKLTVQ